MMPKMDVEASGHSDTADPAELKPPARVDVSSAPELPGRSHAVHHELEQTRARLRRALQEVAALTRALEAAETEAATFQQRDREFEEARAAYYELDAMEQSLSWRITRPLRRLARVFRRIRRPGI